MPDIDFIITHGLTYSILLTLLLTIVVIPSPRLMLQDYPKSIVNAVPPKTAREKRLTRLLSIPAILVMLLYPVVVVAMEVPRGPVDFQYIFLSIWGITMFFNIYDLIILDLILFCWITPRFIVIPGTEGHPGYKNVFFHLKAFGKGIIITLAVSLFSAGLVLVYIKWMR